MWTKWKSVFENIFFKHIIVKWPEKYKTAYLFHCPFNTKALIDKIKTNLFCFANKWIWTCRCQTTVWAKAFCQNLLFLSFSATIFIFIHFCVPRQFSRVYSCLWFIFQLFNICRPRFNYTQPHWSQTIARLQHWNSNEFIFTSAKK